MTAHNCSSLFEDATAIEDTEMDTETADDLFEHMQPIPLTALSMDD
mgnify:CR=1 FL=1